VPASPEVGAETLERRARDLLAQLSHDEKLALLEGSTAFWPGMVDIATRDASHGHPWPAGAVPRLGLAGLHFVDGPRGVVLKGGATTFPPPIARGACWDVDLEERIGEAMAREARSFGANWLAAVCVNLLRHPGWGRAQETYGEDPVLLGALGAAMTRGIQRHAVACVKHFALNSIDSSRFLVDVQVSERVLHELYLPHFRDCVEAGAGSVMSAYNRVNGAWCGQHPQLLTAILKQRWGFQGFVVTDFIFGVRDGLAALLAGQDLEMPFRMIFAGCLAEALADGRLPLERVEDALLRQLRMQLAVPEGTYPVSLRGCPEHRALAREAATKAIVLLQNEPPLPAQPPLLPLDPARSLAVIGPLAAVANLGDRGSSDTRPEPGVVVTPLQGLRAAAAPGVVCHASGERLHEATALAAACETALLVLGLDWRLEGEHIHPGDIAPILRQMPAPHPLLRRWWPPVARAIAAVTSYGSARQGGDFAAGDRTDLALPAEQVALIQTVVAANPRTVVVLMGGGAILMEAWRRAVPAILLLWYPGERGGEALADVVFGRVSPSGRLPFAIPTSADHWPDFEPRAPQVRYDLWHGYRRLQRDGHPAAFPFGFGLSYTALRLSDAVAEARADTQTVSVAVSVHNDGAMASAAVVQVYAEPPGVVVERPRRTLVGFGRVSVEPGGCRRLSLAIPLRRLAYFDEASSRFWLEAGSHRLRVAQHSEDAGLVVELAWPATDLGP
jgi:beta-glucosidase